MKKLILLLGLSQIHAATNSELSQIKAEHKKNVQDWHNKYFKDSSQQEASLYAQKIYYLFKSLNIEFESEKKIDPNLLKSSKEALNEIDSEIKKIKQPVTSEAIIDLSKKLNEFKPNINRAPEKSLFEFFNYLATVYETIYKSLDNKQITVGVDKNKNLPKAINVPTEKEIESVLKKLNTFEVEKKKPALKELIKKITLKQKSQKKAVMKPKKRIKPTFKPKIIKTTLKPKPQKQKPIVLKPKLQKKKPIRKKAKAVVSGSKVQPSSTDSATSDDLPAETATQTSAAPTDLTAEIKTQTSESPQVVQKLQVDLTELLKLSNNFCPFINKFLRIPTVPADVPTDGQGLTNFITNFNDAVASFQDFVSDYSSQLQNWQSNNQAQNFNNLIGNMKTAKTNYDNAKNAHTNCVNNAPDSSKCTDPDLLKAAMFNVKCAPTPALACTTELTNYINAADALYNSYAAILDFLTEYNLAPIWYVQGDQGREYKLVGGTYQSQTKVAVVDNQNVGIKVIKDFNSVDFTNQINAMIQQITSCSDSIKKINDTIKQINDTIKSTSDKITHNASMLKGLQITPKKTISASPEGFAVITSIAEFIPLVGSGASTKELVLQIMNINLNLEMFVADPLGFIEFTAAQEITDEIALALGADTEFIKSIGSQINKNLIKDWSFEDTSPSGIATSILKGLDDILTMLVWGPMEIAATLQASITAVLSGSGGEQYQKAEEAGASLVGGLGSGSDTKKGNEDGCYLKNQPCTSESGGYQGHCWNCLDQKCADKHVANALLCTSAVKPLKCGTPDKAANRGDPCCCDITSSGTCLPDRDGSLICQCPVVTT